MSGRPLRFFGVTLVGWVAVRAVMLWPTTGPTAIPRALIPAAFADDATRPRIPMPLAAATLSFVRSARSQVERATSYPTAIVTPHIGDNDVGKTRELPIRIDAVLPAGSAGSQTLLAPPSPLQPTAQPSFDRLSASAWFVLRDGRGIASGLSGGRLGGSQAGLRIAYALGDARRVAIVARIASPLMGKGREAAVGIEWQPIKLPVRLVAEYRATLDGGRSGPAAGVVAGTGPAPLAWNFDLETYGQAGAIRRRRIEPFAEGAARLSRPVAGLGSVKIDLGFGTWGGAQRGAQRLDMGPSLGARVPVAGKSVRLSLDWRQRVAGNARPGSGAVLQIGSDF